MKALNKQATKILLTLVSKAEENKGNVRLGEFGDVFMPVCVEILRDTEDYRLISVAHYYKQNGDMMADPEMCFIVYKKADCILPYYFKQDGGILAREEESIVFEGDKVKGCYPRRQAEHTTFANMWMKNIEFQQSI